MPEGWFMAGLNILYNKSDITIKLEDYTTMPGFAIKLQESKGSLSSTSYFISKKNLYPIGINAEFSSKESPNQKVVFKQSYYDIGININLDKDELFNTSESSISQYKITQITPK